MDEKDVFKLNLQGYDFGGHLEYWSVYEGDMAAIKEGANADSAEYTLLGRQWGYEIMESGDDRYVLKGEYFFTLGEEVSHPRLVDILAGKVEGKYHDPDFAARDDILRARRNEKR